MTQPTRFFGSPGCHWLVSGADLSTSKKFPQERAGGRQVRFFGRYESPASERKAFIAGNPGGLPVHSLAMVRHALESAEVCRSAAHKSALACHHPGPLETAASPVLAVRPTDRLRRAALPVRQRTEADQPAVAGRWPHRQPVRGEAARLDRGAVQRPIEHPAGVFRLFQPERCEARAEGPVRTASRLIICPCAQLDPAGDGKPLVVQGRFLLSRQASPATDFVSLSPEGVRG